MRTRSFKLSLLGAMLALALAPACFAQDVYAIESDGIATVDVAPAFVVFRVELLPQGPGAAEAALQADEFEATVRREIQDRTLQPTQLSFSGLNYSHVANMGFNAMATIRFPAGQFTVGDDAPQKFAALYDHMMAIANTVKSGLQPVTYEVGDPAATEAAAVARAVEKAYPNAKATADILSARIVSVGNVRVNSVTWSNPASPPDEYNIRRMTCTAHVSVSYIYVPAS